MIYKIDILTLLSGLPIELINGVVINHPKVGKLGEIGEKNFFESLSSLNVDLQEIKNSVPEENFTDFQIYQLLFATNKSFLFSFNSLLKIVCDNFQIYEKDYIIYGVITNNEAFVVTEEFFEQLISTVKEILCFNKIFGNKKESAIKEDDDEKVKEIKAKLAKANEKLNINNGDSSEEIDILSRYVSVLSIGLRIPISIILEWTIYQLFNQFDRYLLNMKYDQNFRIGLAGGSSAELSDWLIKL